MVDASPTPESTPAAAPGFGTRLLQDGRALRTWIGARLTARRHRRAGTRRADELQDALRALGGAALGVEAAGELDGHAAARACREALAQAEASHTVAAETRAVATAEVERADAAARKRMVACSASIDAAADAVRAVERDARAALAELEGLQARVAAPATRAPAEAAAMAARITVQKTHVASFGEALEKAQAALTVTRDDKEVETRRLAEERAPLAAALERASAAEREAADALVAARTRDGAARLVLGRAVLDAAPAAPELTEPLAAARRAEAAVAGSAAAVQVATDRARASAAGAGRCAWKAATALAIVIVLAVVALGAGDDDRQEPRTEVATAAVKPSRAPPDAIPAKPAEVTEEPTAPLPGPTLAPAAPVDEPPPAPEALLTPAVREAVLALPSLAEERKGDVVLQRPVGAPTAETVRPVAGGGWRLRLRVEVERRVDANAAAQRFVVIVDVLTNRRGEPLQVRSVGEVDPEFEALFDD